jgi:hypothetical protein
MLLSALAAAAPPTDAKWAPLQSSPVRIDCADVPGRPYCRSTAVIGVPLAVATRTFEELDRHQDKMGAITLVERLEADVLHVVMDYPFPLSDRDYVARFTRRAESDGTVVYAWTPIEHAAAPPLEGVVRLTWLDGEWRFAAEGSHTRLTYVWESDPGGNLPDVRAVRSKAGFLAIQDMASACGANILGP